MHILGDKKKRRYNEVLIEIVNKKYAEGKDMVAQSSEVIVSNPLFTCVCDERTVEFEPESVLKREGWNYSDFYFSFDKSLGRLKSEGWDRHPRPKEIFTVLMDYIENGVGSKYKTLAENMLRVSMGEWTGCASTRKGNELILVLDPENLVFVQNEGYVINGKNLKCANFSQFDIGNIPSHKAVPLNEFPDELVKFLYGRKFEDLPQEMREGKKKAMLSIGSDDHAHVFSRGRYNDSPYYLVSEGGVCAASRGVRFK